MRRPHRPPQLHGRVFRAHDVLDNGLLTRDALRSSAWRRLYRGVYADADLPASYALRIRRVPLPAVDLTERHGFRCTRGLRTVLDIARSEPLLDGVPALDVLLRDVVVGIGELREAGAHLAGGRGAAVARRAIALVDPRAESPPESVVRVLLALAGIPAVPQHVVRDREGAFVARVDLAYVERKLAIEYDGYWHGERGQFARDRRRLNRLVAAGWTVLHVTAADLKDPEALIARVRRLLAGPESGEVGA